jgi:beta-lactamase class A
MIDRVTSTATISIWCGGLDGTPWLTHDENRVHPAASTFKLALLIALHRAAVDDGRDLDEEIDVRAVLPSAGPGATYETTRDYDNDELPWLRLGGTASLRWLSERSVVRSSNLATNLLLDRLGIRAVNAVFERAGATGCVVRRPIQDTPASAAGLGNEVTASGLAAVLCDLARHGPGEVERTLAACEDDQMAAAGLPAGIHFAHKPGWFDGVCHDAGIVRPGDGDPFVLVVLTASALDEHAAQGLVADTAGLCWESRR